jgi:hypothetical protein
VPEAKKSTRVSVNAARNCGAVSNAHPAASQVRRLAAALLFRLRLFPRRIMSAILLETGSKLDFSVPAVMPRGGNTSQALPARFLFLLAPPCTDLRIWQGIQTIRNGDSLAIEEVVGPSSVLV